MLNGRIMNIELSLVGSGLLSAYVYGAICPAIKGFLKITRGRNV